MSLLEKVNIHKYKTRSERSRTVFHAAGCVMDLNREWERGWTQGLRGEGGDSVAPHPKVYIPYVPSTSTSSVLHEKNDWRWQFWENI